MTNDYEIFISYAHGDDDQGFISMCVDHIQSVYRKKTGVEPRIFIDHSDIMSSEIWDSKIELALNRSTILLSFLSPSYICSQWCLKEYGMFVNREGEYHNSIQLPEHSGLIFPVLLHQLDRGRFSSQQELFKDSLLKRQYFDFSSQAFKSVIKENHVIKLVEQLIDSIDDVIRLEKIKKNSSSDGDLDNVVICDYENQLMWVGSISKHEMEFDEAKQFVESLRIGGHSDWRLPTVDELRTLIDESNVPKEPKGSTYPFYEPFNVRRSGRVFSGTIVRSPVDGKSGYYVMNLRNAHIFNGLGEKASVRSVRSMA
ncbi:MAG: DUF1566 domain-containing protein [Candidatus Marinimicrobia bacterium]|nr:DUF1566 domain-containing protein [Candidatus Neomarinimicrobiota bacterium]